MRTWRSRIEWLLFNYDAAWLVMLVLLAAESVLGLLIIRRVPYTEIDWKAYMQEVQGVLDGEYDYLKLRGGARSHPLIGPASALPLPPLSRPQLSLFTSTALWRKRGPLGRKQ